MLVKTGLGLDDTIDPVQKELSTPSSMKAADIAREINGLKVGGHLHITLDPEFTSGIDVRIMAFLDGPLAEEREVSVHSFAPPGNPKKDGPVVSFITASVEGRITGVILRRSGVDIYCHRF